MEQVAESEPIAIHLNNEQGEYELAAVNFVGNNSTRELL